MASDAALSRYVSEGEAAGVHLGYKCRIRKKWWAAPSVWVPDAFLLRQIYDHPRIVANDARATSTDTIHRVRIIGNTDARALAAASINSATFAFAEWGIGLPPVTSREPCVEVIYDLQALEGFGGRSWDGKSGTLIRSALVSPHACCWEPDRRMRT